MFANNFISRIFIIIKFSLNQINTQNTMKKILIFLLILAIGACSQKEDKFVIANKQVGKITDSTRVKDLKTLFKNDSIIKKTEGEGAFEPYDEYLIYDKKQNKAILTVIPVKAGDENSKIRQVEILDNKFHTNKGINLKSTFGELKKMHKIGKIDKSFKYIVVFIDDLNATVDINKTELPLNAQNNRSIKIDETIIPDKAGFKHFVVFINE